MKTLFMIAGPTAVGKTDAAIKVAKHFATEIISADSRQIYSEMSIGTAAPDEHQLAEVKHHLVGHRSVHEYYNVWMYEQEALAALEEIFAGHETAVMAGGSGLYMDVVQSGIDDLPDIEPVLRQQLKDQLSAKGLAWLQNEVAETDPEYFAGVDTKNPNRLLRALEIFHTTGIKFSELRKSQKRERHFRIIKAGLVLPREELNKIINHRVDKMIEKGLVEECRELYPMKELNALNSVGYKEIFSYLDGEISLDKTTEKIRTNTRRYAKRQMTWFRRDREIRWFKPSETDELINYLQQEMKNNR